MPTAKSALAMMRKICLSLADTTEGEHFGEASFRVGKRMFATCGTKDGACRLVFQLEPEHARRLVRSDPRFEPYARQKDGVVVDAADVDDWDEVHALVLESYRLNQPRTRPIRKSSAAARTKKKTVRR